MTEEVFYGVKLQDIKIKLIIFIASVDVIFLDFVVKILLNIESPFYSNSFGNYNFELGVYKNVT